MYRALMKPSRFCMKANVFYHDRIVHFGLIVIVVFSFPFADSLALMMNTRAVDIFVRTVSCTLVQVIFIGSTNAAHRSSRI
jgi:hypothetical protein